MRQTFILLVFSFVLSSISYAQDWQVDKFILEIEQGVDEVNAKAAAKDIGGALKALENLNNMIRFARFDDWYQRARRENAAYQFHLNIQIAPQLNVMYWRDMLQRVDKNKTLLKEAIRDMKYDRELDNQDKALSYLKALYNTAKSVKEVVEKFGTGSFVGGFFSTKEGIDQILEDYKNLENAELQKLETAAMAADRSRMLSKAEKMERNFIAIEEKMGAGFGIVESFNSKINELRTIAKSRDKEARKKIDWTASRYSFEGSSYFNAIKIEGDRLKRGSIQWTNFNESFLSVGNKALQNKDAVLAEIRTSDDENAKYAKRDEVNDAYETFTNRSFAYYKSLEKEFAQGGSTTEKLNLQFRIQGFKPVQYPSGQNSSSGSSGGQISLSTKKAEADVQKFINHIHAEVEEVNALANRKQMEPAINRLNDLNRGIEKDLNFDFEDIYRKAREDNRNFRVNINAKLSGQFKAAYWENSLKKNASLLNDLRTKFYALPKSNARLYWETTYAICKSAYDLSQLKPDVEKELKEGGKQAAWDKFIECKDGIKDDFKKIDKAFKMEYNTPENKADIEALMKKVKLASTTLETMASYMKANEEEASRFYSLIDRLNKAKKEVESGPNKKLSYEDSRFNFNETNYYNRLKVLVNEFKEEELNWKEFEYQWNSLNQEAKTNMEQVINNINASDDLDNKKKSAINTETNDWDYYYDYAVKQHGECFEFNKQFASNNDSEQEDKQLFAGSQVDSKIEAVSGEDDSASDPEDSTPKGFVGKISNNGNGGGTYSSLAVNKLGDKDALEFKVLSGKVQYIQIIWRNTKGYWFTKYQGNKTEFKAGEFLKDITPDITHFNFVVNAHHNHFTKGEAACEIAVLHFPSGENSTSKNNSLSNSNLSGSSAFEGAGSKTNTSTPSGGSIKSKGFVGKVINSGNGLGQWRSLKVNELADKDILELKLLSGKMDYVTVIWEKNQWSKVIKYSGNRTRFEAGEFLKNVPSDIVWLTFVVNSKDTRYKAGEVKCEMELCHYPSKDRQRSKDTQAIEVPKQKHIAEINNDVAGDFNVLLKKAADAFNKPYWKESNGPKASSNPKQESLNYLKRAEQLIDQQSHIEVRYGMVYRLVQVYSVYAKRVFANTAKVDFINAAGRLVSRYGGKVSSVTKGINGKTPAEERSVLYVTIAGSWRELTKAAMWGGHQYNKGYCDKQTKINYEKALNENPSDYKIKRTLEAINAPKPVRK